MTKQEFQYKLGRHIAKLRKAKKLTQQDFGYLLDKEKQTINRIENGRTNITTYNLYEIAKALELDIKNLVDFNFIFPE